MSYKETVDYLIKNTSLTEEEVFRYTGTPLEDYFEKLFRFYSGNLKHNSKFGANPSYIVFYNRNEIYAGARKSKNHYIIGFDKGIGNKLSAWYNQYFDFSKIPGLEEFKKLEVEINYRIAALLEQAINHYIFYHEFGHLIQRSLEEEFERSDYLSNNCEFDYQKHIEEIDADNFSGLSLATHFYESISKFSIWSNDSKKKEELIAISISGIMAFILALPMCSKLFYTKEYEHPHNSLRANNILNAILNQLKDILPYRDSKINLDYDYIHRRSFEMLNHLLRHFNLDEILNQFTLDMSKGWKIMSDYHGDLYKDLINFDSSAVNRWNNTLE